jgi:hypothetical protein
LKVEYLVYSLTLSTDAPIPGLVPVEIPQACDVDVRFLEKAAPVFEDRLFSRDLYYADPRYSDRELPALSVWRSASGDSYRFAYCDGTEFVLDLRVGRIWARWPEPLTLEDTATYLLGPILGYWLRLQGTPCLHASAVAVDSRAIGLLGPAGAGKSTAAAAFSRRGIPVLSDDVVAIREQGERFMVSPGYPRLRLWPESVRDLYGTVEALPRLTPNWDKRYLDLTMQDDGFQREPLPLAAIYILGERRADSAAPVVESVPVASRLMALVANTYTNYLLDKAMRAEEFHALARLIARVPVRRVIPHADPTFINRLCDVILDDYRTLTPQPSGESLPSCTRSTATAR